MADITSTDAAAPIAPSTARDIRARSDRFVALVIAGLLLFAAIAKGYQAMHMRTAALLLPEAMLEIALAIWLASGFLARSARRASLVAFAIFAMVSLMKIHQGAVSCGCFGAIRVSPVAMFWVDSAIVVVLIVSSARHAKIARASIAGVMLIAAGVGLHIARPISVPHVATIPATAPADLNLDAVGAKVSQTEWLADTGDIAGGRIIRAVFNVENPTNRPLAITDVVPGCHCTSVPNPPEVIPASGSVSVEVDVDVSQEPGEFEQAVELKTQDREFPILLLRVAGNVVLKQ